MAWRFRRSFRIFPGVRINLGKKGTSLSLGGRGFTHTIGQAGNRTTVGIPGTGLSHTTYKKHASQPPPLPHSNQPPQQSMARPKRSGKIFFILGGGILGLAFLSAIFSGGSKSPASPRPVAISTTTATPVSTPVAGPAFTPVPSATGTPVPTPASANATPVMQQRVEKAQPVIKEPNPPSDNYVPDFVRLTSPISMPLFEKGQQTGIAAVPIGTKVKLVKIKGLTIEISHEGQKKQIPASSTDLLSRMLGTAED